MCFAIACCILGFWGVVLQWDHGSTKTIWTFRCLYSENIDQLKLFRQTYTIKAFEVACAISTLLSRERCFHELRKEVRGDTEKRRVSPMPFRSAPAKCSPKKETTAYINHGLVRAVYICLQLKRNSHIGLTVLVTKYQFHLFQIGQNSRISHPPANQ